MASISKTAGGRMPLTPSPRNSPRLLNDASPSVCTPPLFATALPKSTARKSAKSNIATATSPKRLELGLSEWSLTGTGATPSKARASRPRPSKSTVRIAYNAADRFIPNRNASEGICNIGTGKLDLDRRPKSSSAKNQDGSSILASAASTAGAFEIGGRGSDDDVTRSLDGLDLDDDDTKSSYSKPAPAAAAYEDSIAKACGINTKTRILAFKPAPPESSKPIDLRSQYNRPLKPTTAVSAQLRRRILTSPDRVLDAPNIVDDYYLNLLDWSCNNQVAIGLGQSVYVWSADSGSVASLLETSPDTYVSSLKWSGDGAYVSVGLGTGEVQIWDVEEGTKLRSMFGHDSRVSVMGKSNYCHIRSSFWLTNLSMEQAHPLNWCSQRLALQSRCSHRPAQDC
jgi:cell division cycle protein 20 (cofactor of APC complex)